MSPRPSTRRQDPAPRAPSTRAPGGTAYPRAAGRLGLAVALLLALSGCAQVREIGCVSRCQEVKDRCDADARYDFAQCQAGYGSAYRDYRWCLASSSEQCGYPWWSCSENRYGYCTNRYWECRNACRPTRGR